MNLLLNQYEALIEDIDDKITLYANTCAFIYHSFENISWAGFYLVKNDELHLGPFQGKVACTKISFNRGVCGASFTANEILNVPDVHMFKDHIACDSATNSELVLPIYLKGAPVGVLDLDSIEFNRFDKQTEKTMAELVELLKKQLLKCE